MEGRGKGEEGRGGSVISLGSGRFLRRFVRGPRSEKTIICTARDPKYSGHLVRQQAITDPGFGDSYAREQPNSILG